MCWLSCRRLDRSEHHRAGLCLFGVSGGGRHKQRPVAGRLRATRPTNKGVFWSGCCNTQRCCWCFVVWTWVDPVVRASQRAGQREADQRAGPEAERSWPGAGAARRLPWRRLWRLRSRLRLRVRVQDACPNVFLAAHGSAGERMHVDVNAGARSQVCPPSMSCAMLCAGIHREGEDEAGATTVHTSCFIRACVTWLVQGMLLLDNSRCCTKTKLSALPSRLHEGNAAACAVWMCMQLQDFLICKREAPAEMS